MKTKVLNYIDEIIENTGIQIKINIGYQSDNNLYGSVTIGSFGFMLHGTWQPQSDTTFQFKIEGSTGNVFDYETIFLDHKPQTNRFIIGNFKDVFHKEITNAIKACIGWSLTAPDKTKYKNALKKIEALSNGTAN